jgi:orotate phosphoribosyltransferase
MREDPAAATVLARALADVVLARGYRRAESPFRLSSGGESYDYVDLRRALSRGEDLRLAAETVLAFCAEQALPFDAIGGMTMGADPIAHATALVGGSAWFSIRKTEKQHGTGQRIEGATIGSGTRVLVVEDTTSTGRSLLDAVDVAQASGAEIVAALTLLDRGAATAAAFAPIGVPFFSVLTYADLGIAPLELPPPAA